MQSADALVIEQTELLALLPVAVYTTDAEGRLTFYNQAAAELWGHHPELGAARWCGSLRLFDADSRPMPHAECPMALALREERPIRGVEAVLERPDGTRVPFLPHPTPIRDSSGRITGAINMLVDLSDREAARLSSALLASIVASSEDAIVSKTIGGRVTSWNAGAERIFGYTSEEMIGQPIVKIIPAEMREEEDRIIAKLRRGERVEHFDTVRQAKDGRLVDISVTISPLRNATGEVVGASKVARDISERKQAERSQRLLLDELNHRVKNTLATVQAIANLSSRGARGPDEFVAGFTGRIQALSKAHTLLAQARMEGAEIGDLVREQVLLGESADHRVSCAGPALLVGPQSAVHLAMVLHELATNARKYGALSVAGGRLSVTWELRATEGRTLHLKWQEHGIPVVNVPSVRGFGTTLIEQTLCSQGGSVAMRYGMDGVTAEIRLPLPERELSQAAAVAAAGPQRLHERQSDLAGKRVLVIEDEPLISLDLEMTLTNAGCEIAGMAGTLEQAKELIAGTECDVALLDGNLGGESVGDLAIALTQKNTPFVFVTGYGRDSLPQGFREAVMVAKPFTEAQLRAAIESVLDKTGVVHLRRKTR